MKNFFKRIIPAVIVGVVIFAGASAQVSNPQWKINTPSSTITPVNPALQVPCANIVGGCSSGGGGGISPTSTNTFTVPQNFTGISNNGGVTSTAFAASSTSNSQIQTLNSVYYVPANFATAGAFGSSTLTDFGAVVNYAYSIANASSVAIMVPNITVTQAQWKTPIVFASNYKAPNLICPGGANLEYGATGTAVTFNFGNPTGHLTSQDYGCTYMGSSTLIAAAQTNSATTTGFIFGGSNGAVGIDFHDNNVNGFGTCVDTASNTYIFSFRNNAVSGCGSSANQPFKGSLLTINTASNSGERMLFTQNSFTDPANSTSVNAIYISDNALASGEFENNSIDDAEVYVGISNGVVNFEQDHFENAAFSTYKMTYFIIASSSGATVLNVNDNIFALDNTGATGKLSELIEHAVNLTFNGNIVDNYGGASAITNCIDHALNPGQAVEASMNNDWSQNSACSNWAQLTGTTYPAWMMENQNGYPLVLSVDGGGNWDFTAGQVLSAVLTTGQAWEVAGRIVAGAIQSPATTIQATGVSSTVRTGTSANTSHGCYELYDSVNSSTLEYIYTASGVLVATSTKPNFCQ